MSVNCVVSGYKFLHELVDGTRQWERHAKGVQLQHVLLSKADIRWSPVGASLDKAGGSVLVRLHHRSRTSRHALVPCGELRPGQTVLHSFVTACQSAVTDTSEQFKRRLPYLPQTSCEMM